MMPTIAEIFRNRTVVILSLAGWPLLSLVSFILRGAPEALAFALASGLLVAWTVRREIEWRSGFAGGA